MDKYRIKSTRLQGYDYSRNGAYFVTICTKNKICLLGEIKNDNDYDGNVETGRRPVSTKTVTPKITLSPKIKLSKIGQIVTDCWYDLPNHYSNIILDEFIVMPDHIHGIIIIRNDSDKKSKHGLSEFIRAFKSFSSRRINKLNIINVETGLRPVSTTHSRKTSGVWQLRYYDHIIRSNRELNMIRSYIKNNPVKFHDDNNEI